MKMENQNILFGQDAFNHFLDELINAKLSKGETLFLLLHAQRAIEKSINAMLDEGVYRGKIKGE